MNEPKADVALLTPVPEQHLIAGLRTSAETGFVAFGTEAAITLLEFRAFLDEDHQADILFYASHSQTGGTPHATYRGRFAGYDGAVKGKPKDAWLKHRPPSTENDTSFSGFYLVQNFHRLESPMPIASLTKRNNKGRLSTSFFPHGPIIIDTPF